MAKPKTRAKTVGIKSAVVLREAKLIKDAARAARLERGLDEVKRPSKLAVPLITALREALSFDNAGARVLELCRERSRDVAFLEACGDELDEWFHDETAEKVLQMARAAGAKGSRAMVR